MGISVSRAPTFKKTRKRLIGLKNIDFLKILKTSGDLGVSALSESTPVDTGETASGWTYSIIQNGGSYLITWSNNILVDGIPLVVLLNYGHGTRNGGYVSGLNFIGPTLAPIYDRIKKHIILEVTK